MLHNKAELQLLATVMLMRTEMILLQISAPTKLLQFPLKLFQFQRLTTNTPLLEIIQILGWVTASNLLLQISGESKQSVWWRKTSRNVSNAVIQVIGILTLPEDWMPLIMARHTMTQAASKQIVIFQFKPPLSDRELEMFSASLYQ